MFISNAYAQSAAGGAGGQMLQLLPLVLIFLVFYYLILRPQQRKMKQHREMIKNLRRGDKIVTGGGVIGQISKVDDNGEVTVEIAEGVKIKIIADTITASLSKTEPVEGGESGGEGAKGLKGLLSGKGGNKDAKS